MNFKNWLISEEIYAQNKTATVYHRTCGGCTEDQSVKAVSGILTSDFQSGAGTGCFYGCGLYTTYKIESQFTDYMKMYGKAVIKFTVTNLDKYLIFQLDEAKKIHGNDYKISDQFKKLGLLNKVDESKLKEYDKQQEKENYSSTLAKEFYNQNKWIEKSVKGIIYYGGSDGYCLVKYEPVQDGTITMLGYAVADVDNQQKMEELKGNIGWITSTNKASVKSIYKSPISNREKFSFFDDNREISRNIISKLLNSKNLEVVAKYFGSNLDKLSDNDVFYLLDVATNKDQMAEVIAKYKTNISDWTVDNLLFVATDDNKDKIAELIIKYKTNISQESIRILLRNATNADKIAKLIIEKKPKLSDKDVDRLLNATNYKDINKIIELIIEKQPELSDDNVQNLVLVAKDTEEIAKLIIKKKPELSDLNVYMLVSYTTDQDEQDKIAELIIKNKTELSKLKVFYLLRFAYKIDKIAELLQKETDNISKLTHDNVLVLLNNATYKPKMAQIINQYHTNKTPKIQKEIDKYLTQTQAAK